MALFVTILRADPKLLIMLILICVTNCLTMDVVTKKLITNIVLDSILANIQGNA